MISFKKSLSLLLGASLAATCLLTGCSQSEQTYAKVSAIDGSTLALALGTLDTSGMSGDSAPPSGQQGGPPQGTPPALPSGAASSDGQTPPSGAPQDGGGAPNSVGGPGGAQGGFTESGETKTVTVSSDCSITNRAGEAASLSDIQVGSILRIEYAADGNTPAAIVIQSGAGGFGGASSGGDSTGSIEGSAAYSLDGETAALIAQTIQATQENQSGVKVSGGGSLTLSDSSIQKTGDTASTEESDFYGLNAALLATSQSSINLSNASIATDSEGSNAVFATGEGASIQLSDVTVNTAKNSSRGLDATYSGSIAAQRMQITTAGEHSAAVATDRGEGDVNVSDSTLTTRGEGSPAVYSTGNISVSNSQLSASGSEACVIEGKNSITLTDCTLQSGGDRSGVMLYQSFSGDADVGTSHFNMTNGSLHAALGPLFYITNTNAQIQLENAQLTADSGTLLSASADRWGNAGENGGSVTLTAKNQTLSGNVLCDASSTVALQLTDGSRWSGSLDAANTGKSVSVSLDADSIWSVTGDSYVDSISSADSTFSNIESNGHTIYYDATNSANAAYNAQAIALPGGGQLAPMA